jgi:ABC-type sulfate/molybdate transport systems ATPase subunit
MFVREDTALLACKNIAGEAGPGVRLAGSLDLHAGEMVGLTGPSGSGKSLFLRAIARMDVARGVGRRRAAHTALSRVSVRYRGAVFDADHRLKPNLPNG